MAGQHILQLIEAGHLDGLGDVVEHLTKAAAGQPVHLYRDKTTGEQYYRAYCARAQLAAAKFVFGVLVQTTEYAQDTATSTGLATKNPSR